MPRRTSQRGRGGRLTGWRPARILARDAARGRRGVSSPPALPRLPPLRRDGHAGRRARGARHPARGRGPASTGRRGGRVLRLPPSRPPRGPRARGIAEDRHLPGRLAPRRRHPAMPRPPSTGERGRGRHQGGRTADGCRPVCRPPASRDAALPPDRGRTPHRQRAGGPGGKRRDSGCARAAGARDRARARRATSQPLVERESRADQHHPGAVLASLGWPGRRPRGAGRRRGLLSARRLRAVEPPALRARSSRRCRAGCRMEPGCSNSTPGAARSGSVSCLASARVAFNEVAPAALDGLAMGLAGRSGRGARARRRAARRGRRPCGCRARCRRRDRRSTATRSR